MELAIALVWAAFGAVFGSFMTVVAYRVPRKQSIVAPRSRCPACETEILSRDNIPVVSWIVRRGRCRACGERISVRYPLMELLSAGLFVLAGLTFIDQLYLAVVMAAFYWVLLTVSVIDLERMIIPNAIVYPAYPVFGILVGVGALLGAGPRLLPALIGMLAYGGIMLVIAIAIPRGMGMGDAKLCGLIGLVLGSLGAEYVLVAAAAAILAGGVAGVISLLATGGKSNHLPFGPALAAGAVASSVAAPAVWAWYQGLVSAAS